MLLTGSSVYVVLMIFFIWEDGSPSEIQRASIPHYQTREALFWVVGRGFQRDSQNLQPVFLDLVIHQKRNVSKKCKHSVLQKQVLDARELEMTLNLSGN